jgi:hypothetical protein
MRLSNISLTQQTTQGLFNALLKKEKHTMKVVLAFKNPSRPLNDTFEIESLLEASIGELKQTLHGVYPGNPLPEAITVSFQIL